MTAPSSADSKRAAQSWDDPKQDAGDADPEDRAREDAAAAPDLPAGDDAGLGTAGATPLLPAGRKGGQKSKGKSGKGVKGGVQAEARRATAAAARAEAEAALEARKQARAIAVTNRAEKELARAEAAADKAAAIDNAAPPVRRARAKQRHYMIITSFVFMVLLPAALAGWYLWERATDQYASYVGFSVRTEEQGASIESLFGVSDLSGSSSSDTDILYEFLQSQQLVARVDDKLNVREMWARPGVQSDPIFAYAGPGTIEDLTNHWGRKVKIYYDSNSGLIDLRVLAFEPDEAQAVAQSIYDESSAMINELSAIAREDAIGYARDELTEAEERLRQARTDLQIFRNRTQIIDPTIQSQTQSGLIGALETELAQAQIDLQLLRDTANEGDPRFTRLASRIAAIEKQIDAERSELGLEGADQSASVADLVGQYEVLVVDLEFAQEAYTAARAAYDGARNEARRQSRYLAAHVPPTLAERAEYPDRSSTMMVIVLFLFLAWSFLVLAAYALRDRR